MRLKNLLVACFVFAALPVMAQTALLNPNKASETELASVPHLTPALVQTIVAKRPLASPTALDQLLSSNLNEAQRRQAYSRMFVPLNLNAATTEDIMLIPGMTKSLASEFKEYRPYKAIGEFRHEIGKYLKKPEVERLEKYVFVPAKN